MKRQTQKTAQSAFASPQHRFTKQRKSIIRYLTGMKRYVTAQELHARIVRAQPRTGLATVYRTLEALREMGLVATLAQQHGETAYLYCGREHHHHAVCTQCGRVDEVPCRADSKFERMLSNALRFRLTGHQLEFYGVCARCS